MLTFRCDDNDNADDIPAKKTAEDVKIDTNKLDELWNDFCSDQSSTAAKSDDNKSAESPKKVTTMTKQYDFAGEIVLIKETVDASSVAKTPNVDQQSSSTMAKNLKTENNNHQKTIPDWIILDCPPSLKFFIQFFR